MQSLTLHAHAGPNPWKCALLLRALSIPYTIRIWATPDLKTPPFTTTLNPNGYTPVLEDPNTGLKLWESGAICQYILAKYDPDHRISFTDIREQALVWQYSYFQATFQGPHLTNAFYFKRNSNEEAQRRFVEESIRVMQVLDDELEGKEFLVGGRMSAADLVLVPYFWSAPFILGESMPDLSEKGFKNLGKWLERLEGMDVVKEVKEERKVETAKAGGVIPGRAK